MKKLKCGCGRVIGQYEWVDCEFKIVCVSCLNKQSALSRESAYRAALEKIAKNLEGPIDFNSIPYKLHAVGDIARAALDRKPEEPVGREVSREELAKELDIAWESFELDFTKPVPQTQDDVDESNAEFDLFVADHILKTLRVERRG